MPATGCGLVPAELLDALYAKLYAQGRPVEEKVLDVVGERLRELRDVDLLRFHRCCGPLPSCQNFVTALHQVSLAAENESLLEVAFSAR